MAGKFFRVRFILSFSGGGYYSSGSNLGWFIDQIQFSGLTTPHSRTEQVLATNSVSFTPDEDPYLLAVAPVISGRDFPTIYQTLAVSPPPAPTYASWATSIENGAGLPAGALADPNGDHDKDGRSNLVEYAFGCSPVVPNDASARLPVVQPSSSHLVLRYQKDTALADITLVPEAGTMAGSWHTPGQPGAPAGFTDTLISTSAGIETREATLPRSSGARGFLRMKVSRP